MPMSTTSVPPARASDSQSTAPGLPRCADVAGHHGDRRSQAPLRDGHARRGRHGEGRGHPGDHLEGHARGPEGCGLLAAPPEHEGVAALQAHHRRRPAAVLHQESVDVGLALRTGLPDALAHVDPHGLGRRQVQEPAVHEAVEDDDVGPPQQLGPPPGEQPRVAGAGPHQVDGHDDVPERGAQSSSGGTPLVEQVAGQAPSPR